MMDIEELRADLAAFADDEGEVALDENGVFLMSRGGREISGQLVDVDGNTMVRRDGEMTPYSRFMSHELGQLHQLAERLSRRSAVGAFVDGQATIYRPAEEPELGSALEWLAQECREKPPFAARVSFITADAGHGKTALLKEHQSRQAEAFLAGTSGYVFWHVDLQGRQLLRLSEALMGDLADLRLQGLWMPAVIRLIRRGALILAIDGFDELAAEQGGTNAIGSLATLVSQLGGHGVVIAAARRTFFDTDDYIIRAGILGRAVSSPCVFDQITLAPWTDREGIQFLSRYELEGQGFPKPSETYALIKDELGGDDQGHPMVTRPFLLSQVAKALLTYGVSPGDFIRSGDDPLSGVAVVLQAFVRREVQEKWRNPETGEPYLTVDQHMSLLSDVAEEMYRGQRDRLEVEVVETIATILLDQWGVDPGRRHQILEMVRMHVLLVEPSDAAPNVRAFDHPEFRDYFMAYALRAHLDRVMDGAPPQDLARFLSIAQISDSTALYVCGMLERSDDRVRALLAAFEEVVAKEWKPTFLQVNIGTIVPFVCDGMFAESSASFSARVIYSSLVLDRRRLSNLTIEHASFVNVSLTHAQWTNVVLKNCSLGELTVGPEAVFDSVVFDESSVDGIRIVQEHDEDIREYAPERIRRTLKNIGIDCSDPDEPLPIELEETYLEKCAHRVIRILSRSTVISERQIVHKFKQDHDAIIEDLIPVMERHGILSERTWKGSGNNQIWGMNERFDDILQAQSGVGKANLVAFWRDVAATK